MKRSFLGLGILGILLILFGSVFALQGDSVIGGSSMTGSSFWLYAGIGIAVVGVILAALSFSMGSRRKSSEAAMKKETAESGAVTGSEESSVSSDVKKTDGS